MNKKSILIFICVFLLLSCCLICLARINEKNITPKTMPLKSVKTESKKALKPEITIIQAYETANDFCNKNWQKLGYGGNSGFFHCRDNYIAKYFKKFKTTFERYTNYCADTVQHPYAGDCLAAILYDKSKRNYKVIANDYCVKNDCCIGKEEY